MTSSILLIAPESARDSALPEAKKGLMRPSIAIVIYALRWWMGSLPHSAHSDGSEIHAIVSEVYVDRSILET